MRWAAWRIGLLALCAALVAGYWLLVAPALWKSCRADGLSRTTCARMLVR